MYSNRVINYTYKLYTKQGGEVGGVYRLEDNVSIPAYVGNKDWDEYLVWLSQGNEPLPADE